MRVVEAAFESWEPEDAPYDAVVAFASFHWVDPAVRYAKAASMLRPGGAFAIAGYLHVLPADGDPFFREVQADYDAVLPDGDNRPPPNPDEVDADQRRDRVLSASSAWCATSAGSSTSSTRPTST